MMTPETFAELLTPTGINALTSATELAPTETSYPAVLDRLRKHYPDALCRMALDQVLLRRKATAKFSQAGQMFFTREAYEMASSESLSQHRVKRFQGYKHVADFCCGLGADALALASVTQTTALDRDPLMIALCQANLAAFGLQGEVLKRSVLTAALEGFDAIFADPGRRGGGHRSLDVEDYEPPLSAIRKRLPTDFALAVKVAPGVPRENLTDATDAEVEFVSLKGELKECIFWYGPLKTAHTRATLLPSGDTLTGDPTELCDFGPMGEYLHDPDATISRSGLLAALAQKLDARQYDPGLAMLTSDTQVSSPFATSYRIEAFMPWDLKRVKSWCQQHNVGRLTLLKRGVTIDVNEVTKKLKVHGDEAKHLIFTRHEDRLTAILAVPV
jgi:hypothetical protein